MAGAASSESHSEHLDAGAGHLGDAGAAAPINKAMLLGNDQPPSRSSINRWADQAVRTFLAAYRIVDDAAG